MTSNVGARLGEEVPRLCERGSPWAKMTERTKSVQSGIPNRLDMRIRFGPLQPEVMHRIVDKFIWEMEGLLAEKKVTLECTEALERNSRLATMRPFGARPLARVIQEHVKQPLSEEILFGNSKTGAWLWWMRDGDSGDSNPPKSPRNLS